MFPLNVAKAFYIITFTYTLRHFFTTCDTNKKFNFHKTYNGAIARWLLICLKSPMTHDNLDLGWKAEWRVTQMGKDQPCHQNAGRTFFVVKMLMVGSERNAEYWPTVLYFCLWRMSVSTLSHSCLRISTVDAWPGAVHSKPIQACPLKPEITRSAKTNHHCILTWLVLKGLAFCFVWWWWESRNSFLRDFPYWVGGGLVWCFPLTLNQPWNIKGIVSLAWLQHVLHEVSDTGRFGDSRSELERISSFK
jgi:hypothetical protein